jgi:hypothetical protein
MRNSGWTSSIVPKDDDQNVYTVPDDVGRSGGAYRETDVERTDLETVTVDALEGQYKNPVRVIGFNIAGSWSQDVSADVARSFGTAVIYSNEMSPLLAGFHRSLRRTLSRRAAAAARSAWHERGAIW